MFCRNCGLKITEDTAIRNGNLCDNCAKKLGASARPGPAIPQTVTYQAQPTPGYQPAPGYEPPPGYQPAPGYEPPPGYQPYYAKPEPGKNSKKAMILGILSIVIGFPFISIILAAIGRAAYNKAEREGEPETSIKTAGKYTTLVGLILGIITTVLIVIEWILLAFLLSQYSYSPYYYPGPYHWGGHWWPPPQHFPHERATKKPED